MDRLIALLGYEWLIRWRGGAKRLLRGDVLAMTLILFSAALLKFTDYVRSLALANPRPAVILLLTLFLGWVAWWGYDKGPAIPRVFPYFPLSRLDLLGLRVASGFASPLQWGLAVSAGATFPLFRGTGPSRVMSLAGYILFCLSAGVLFSVVRDRVFANKRCAVAVLVLVVLSLFFLPWGSFLGVLTAALSPPFDKSATAGMGICLLGCAALFLVLAGAAETFPLPENKSGPAPTVVFPRSGANPGGEHPELLVKDLRILSKSLEPYLGLLILMQYLHYLAYTLFPHPLALLGGCFAISAIFCPVALNSFGLESQANLLRYDILPLSGRRLLVSKNVAGILMMGILLVPMVVLGGFKSGFLSSILGILLSLDVLLMFMLFGNATSVRFPERTRPYHFTSLSLEAGIVRMVVVYFLCYLPGMVIILAARRNPLLALVLGLAGLFPLAFAHWRRIAPLGKILEVRVRKGMHYPKG